MTLTEIDVERLMSPAGGFRADSIAMLGEDVTVKGWRRRLVGKVVKDSDYEQAKKIVNLPRLKHVPFGESRGQMALI